MLTGLEDDACSVSDGGRTVAILRFADDIDGLARSEKVFARLVNQHGHYIIQIRNGDQR